MSQIIISRTEALRRMREKLGSPVRNLNTIVIGLHAVGAGQINKPADLCVTWNIQDLKRAEAEARGFSIRSLMTVACDALDHYLFDIGKLPSPIQDGELISILTRQTQIKGTPQVLSDNAIEDLKRSLLSQKTNPKELKKCLMEFSARFCGEQNRPSIRARHQKLFEFTTNHRVMEARRLSPSKNYFAAIELLIAWRNELVHDTDEGQLSNTAIEALIENSQALATEHAGIDINQTIARYRNKQEPSLKDVSTLVSILLRYASSIDKSLLSGCNISEFFKDSIAYEITKRENGIETLRKWAGKSLNARIEKANQLVAGHGFVPASFKMKKDYNFKCTVTAEDLNFLGAKGIDGLRAALGLLP